MRINLKDEANIVIIIFIILISVFAGLVFFNRTDTNPIINENFQNTNTEASNIVWRMYKTKPEFSYSYEISNKQYIISLFSSHLVIIKKEGDIWNEIYSKEIIYDNLQEKEIVEIKNKKYLYFESQSGGNILTSISFTLFSFENFNMFQINVSGPYGDVSDMEINPLVQQNTEVKEYLLKKVEKSDNVTHASDLENNPYSPKNAELLFTTNNGDLREKLQYIQPQKIVIQYYKENLFDLMGENSITSAIENSKYKVLSYFKSSIIVFDKTKNLYFIAFTPLNKYNWVTQVEWFDNDETIIVVDTNEEVFSIKLDTNEINRIK